MPPAIKYVDDPNSDQARTIEEAFDKEMRARQEYYELRWEYYLGNHRRHLAPDSTGTDDNLVVNLIELGVDKGIGRLMGVSHEGSIKGPDFDIADAEQEPPGIMQRVMNGVRQVTRQPQEKSPEQTYLDKVWQVNLKSIFLHDIGIGGALCGHNFVKLVPEGVPDPDDPNKTLVRFLMLNPANTCKFWDYGDVDRVLWYRVQYGKARLLSTEPGRKRQDIVRAVDADGNDEGYWLIRDFEEKVNTSGWKLIKEDTWDYAWPPIVDWKNLPKPNDAYGLDDIRRNGNLNDGLNFTLSNMQRIIKYHAQPNTVITGATADDLQPTGIDRLWSLQPAEAKVYNVEMQSDLSSSLALAQAERGFFFDGIRELDPATVKDQIGNLTNFGLRVLYGDALQKTGTKRLLYGHALRLVCQYALELGGFAANIKVTDKWPDPLPTDPLVTAQALQIDRANGLSQDTYLEQRGFDPELEAVKRERERGETVMDQTMQRQGSLLDNMKQGMMGNGKPTNGATGGRDVTGMDRRGPGRNG